MENVKSEQQNTNEAIGRFGNIFMPRFKVLPNKIVKNCLECSTWANMT